MVVPHQNVKEHSKCVDIESIHKGGSSERTIKKSCHALFELNWAQIEEQNKNLSMRAAEKVSSRPLKALMLKQEAKRSIRKRSKQ